jgi:hypothetical protein
MHLRLLVKYDWNHSVFWSAVRYEIGRKMKSLQLIFEKKTQSAPGVLRKSLVILRQSLLDAFTRFDGEFLRCGVRQFFRMFVRGLSQKTDSLSIAPTPLADCQMQPKSHSFGTRQRVVEPFGLGSRGSATVEGESLAA